MHPKELSNFDVITHVYAHLNIIFYTKQPYVTCILINLGLIKCSKITTNKHFQKVNITCSCYDRVDTRFIFSM